MNTAERIVEAYFRHCLGCFTMSDVKVRKGNNRQLDLLAVNLRSGIEYHVETSVKHDRSWQITWSELEKKLDGKFFGAPAEKTNPNSDYQRGKNYYQMIRQAYRSVGFVTGKIRRVWVTWSTPDEEFKNSLTEYCRNKRLGKNQIEVWSLRDDLLPKLIAEIGTSNYDDDILRTLSLLRQYESQTADQFQLH